MVVLDAYGRFRWPVLGGLIVGAILLDLLVRALLGSGGRGSHRGATEHTEKKEI